MLIRFKKVYFINCLLTLIVIVTNVDEIKTNNLTELINHWNRNKLRSDNNQQEIKFKNSSKSDFKGSPIIPTINNLTKQFVDYNNNNQVSSLFNNNNNYYQDNEALIKAFLDLLLAYRINRLPKLQDPVVIEGIANGFGKWFKQLTNYIESNPDLVTFGLPSNNTTVFGEAQRLFRDWVKMRGQSMNDWWKTITKYSNVTTTVSTINL